VTDPVLPAPEPAEAETFSEATKIAERALE
jgi:hypothetical protein